MADKLNVPSNQLENKKILIFSDGTGQYGGLKPDQRLSNIYKMYRAMRSGPDSTINPAQQVAFYDPGLGSGEDGSRTQKLLSAAFGTGISENIVDCYEAILKSYNLGDRIFLFGFSRGAYTARCVANVLNLCGVPTINADGSPLPTGGPSLRKVAEEAVYKVYEHGSGKSRKLYELQREEQARRFRAKYKCAGLGTSGEEQGNVAPTFIGVFDTVAALGDAHVRLVLLIVAVAIGALLSYYTYGSTLSIFWAAMMFFAPMSVLTLWVSLKQFKFIRNPPEGGRFSYHFAAWNLKHYDRYLDSSVGYARHAISIDENRSRFPRVSWGASKDIQEQKRGDLEWLKQVWFSGNHSDIGGSYLEQDSRLSDIALQWMLDELDLIPNPPHINTSLVSTYPDSAGLQHDEVKSSREIWPRWWPFKCALWRNEIRKVGSPLHETVIERFKFDGVPHYDERKPYRPENLRNHKEVKDFY